ncbi:hypothetical protein QR680_011596 [Steinernema hermaphroditum]|uniref:RNA-directed DNA polymerase n=1 Tax=Steinernema hermaphroditum TaxID=289476 RepID=A0AA39LYZ3_9BILA|nr:hypothetical protein QR680_011596 [Steinernema hermaphroditum]
MEKKALAIVFALQQFAPYIEGNGVTTVRTDNQPICALLKKQNLPPRLQRFQLAIQSYNIDLHHQSGDSNKMCDFLSRYPVANPGNEDLVALLIADIEAQKIDEEAEPEDNEKETPQVSLDEIREEQLKIPEYKKLIDALEAKIPEAVANFELVDGTLRVKAESDADEPRLVIPYALRQRIIEQVHTSPLMNAHIGAEKTFEKLKRRVFWEAMKTDVRKVVTSCEICQKRKLSNQQKHHGPMMIPSEAKQPNEKLHIDLLGPLSPSRKGNAHVLVCVDAFSKYVTAVALPNTVAEALVNEVFLIHSIPEELISDNSAQFTSALWEELVQLIGTKHIRTTPYHPKANGNCERVNLPLVDMIASTAKKCPDEWDKQLKFITFALNTSVHRVTKETPFFLTFGRDARLPIDADWKLQQKDWLQGSEYKTILARRLQAAWDTVRENIAQNREADKAYYDAKHKTKEKPIDVGDLVLIQIPTRKSKLEDRWKGSYRVVQVFRPNLVLADLKTSKTIRIHADRIKRFQEAAMLPLRDHGAAIDWSMRGEEERLTDTEDGETHFVNVIKKDRLCHLIQQPNLRKPLAKFLAEASEMAKKLIHKDISLEDIVSFLNVLVTTELDYFKDGKSPTTSDTYINAKNLLTAIPVNAAEKGEKHTDTEDDERPDDSLWQVNDLQINDLDDATHADETQEQTKDDA